MLGPEPTDGNAVFGDGDNVNLSWLARFVFKKRDGGKLLLEEK